ncbi:MAG: DUF4838 domain-containing protein, partial [Kiritimatiellia bacterium]
YHPQVRARNGLFAWTYLHRVGPGSPEGLSEGYWSRAQRLQLSSFLYPPTCHGPWSKWWDRFHETNPEFFALQPDGTRSNYGNKMCHSNPELAQQWLADVEAELAEDPNRQVFNVSPSDGFYSGHCVCEDCRAWDHPDAEPRRLEWRGMTQIYLALSDRDITFANRCARMLRERFPDKELYVYMLAYGHSCPPPVAAVPDDNVIIGDVANFLFRSDMQPDSSMIGGVARDYFAGWGKLTDLHFWRPNIGAPVGIQWGMPDIPLRRTMADMRFAAENGWMGVHVDFLRMIWSTQGPLYYLMAQLTWNPYADGEAILKDYYQRAFGPAAGEMEAYWSYMEKIREECYGTEQPGRADHDILEFYNAERLDKAAGLLDAGKRALGPDDDLYRKRVAFVEAGLEFTRLITECGRLARIVNDNKDQDGTARATLNAHWDKLRALSEEFPGAVRWQMFLGQKKDGYPPKNPRYAPPLWVDPAPEAGSVAAMTVPEWLNSRNMAVSDEWELVFSDRFDRVELGEDWEVVDGLNWEIADGAIR